MKVTVKRPVEIDVKFLRIEAAVRYEEEDIPNDFPFRTGDVWDVLVDIETGIIVDWPQGRAADVHMKVCDEGSYHLLDANKVVHASIEQDYVPNGVIPGSYGDYIEMTILEDGRIKEWPKKPDLEAFFRDDD